jgi:hypothetical protein
MATHPQTATGTPTNNASWFDVGSGTFIGSIRAASIVCGLIDES